MLFGKRKITVTPYDREKEIPVIRASICSGEQVAGFRSLETGRFTEIMLLKDQKDLEEFLEVYAIDPADIKKEY